MSFLKKQTAGTWATFVTLILALASFIIYLVNIGSEGYFQNAAVPRAAMYSVLVIAILAAVLVLAQFGFQGILGKSVDILSDIMRIIAPVLSVAALVTLVSGRVQGFAFIYFSNEEVLQEVQTAANLASSHGAIASIAALAVTAIAGMAAAFFNLKKKEA